MGTSSKRMTSRRWGSARAQECGSSGQTAVTHRTSVRLLAGVGPLVFGCIALSVKLLRTDGATKGGVSAGVEPFVLRQFS